MKKSLLQICIFISFWILNTAFAQEGAFCNTYNTAITNMNAIDGKAITYISPQPLPQQSFKNMPKIADTYCPPCTLKDQTLCQQRPCQEYNLMPGNIYQGIQARGDQWMKMASEEALKSVQNGGGPFGAVVVQIDDASGKVIRYWVNHNHVREWNDPTAHAEITTIRTATQELGVVDLGHIAKNESKLAQPGESSHCVLYSSAEPCPMCMAATYWAKIPNLIFAATRFDAAAKGDDFSDEMIYDEFKRPYAQRKHMHVLHANTNNSLNAFNYYKRSDVKRYGESH
ncbi:MAG: nucleoside deaminase [Gammaproteobacteria bacterium]